MDEHIKYKKDGDVAGLYMIDTERAKNAGRDMWERIDNIIKAYIDLHPMEMQALILTNKERRADLINDMASTADKSLRLGVSIPSPLLLKIEALYPEIMSDKKLFHKFMKRYPAFRITKHV